MNRRSFFGLVAGLLASAGLHRQSLPIVNAAGTCPDPMLLEGDSEFEIPYTIVVSDATDNPATIFASGCLPKGGSPYPGHVWATVRRVSLRYDKAIGTYHATVHYSSKPLTSREQDQTIAELRKIGDIVAEQLAAQKHVTEILNIAY